MTIIIEVIVLLIIIISAADGWRRGLLLKLYGLIRFVAAIVLTIVLSFGFYIPVVLFASRIPLMGMLMIPKTCAYMWTVLIGYKAMRKEIK